MSWRPRIEHILSGYLYVELRGDHTEFVLTDLAKMGVPLYHVRVRGRYGMVGFGFRDFPQVYKQCRLHRVKIRFVRREGAPFWMRRARRRKAFFLGAAVFAVLLFSFQSVIWNVNVTGVDSEEAANVLQAARALGVHKGASIRTVKDVASVQTAILNKLPSLIWVGVNVKGTQVEIQAIEKIPGTTKVAETPHDIVASRPAVIRRVFATRGTVQVKPGQAVQPGQVLISGVLGSGSAYVGAQGTVLAEVWYRSQVQIPLKVQTSSLTGNEIQFDNLQIGSLDLRVWGFKEAKFTAFYDRENDTTWKIGGWQLPFTLQHVTRYEAQASAVQKSEQGALQTALEIASQDVASQSGKDHAVLGQTVLHTEVAHGKLYATILTRTEEDIGSYATIPVPKKGTAESEQSGTTSG